MKWYLSKRFMKTVKDGTQVTLHVDKSEFKNLIEGGRTDHIHLVIELPEDYPIEIGTPYYIGLLIEETFEPYGLQLKMTCYKKSRQTAYFDVEKTNEKIFELLLP